MAEKLAKKIIEFRKNKKFENSQDLKNLILDDENNNHKFKTIMRVFQALRISVNNEIENLTNLLDKIPFLLTNEGLAIFITFHSLEHNLVKKNMLSLVTNINTYL